MSDPATDAIWVEKYRPDTLDEVRGNEAVISRLKDYVDDDSMPNIMLAGQQGIGKTAAVKAFVKDKYGDDWQNHFLQMNASDERGIDVVRNKIKQFAELSTVSDYQYKIVFLDESDNMTRDAMPALRRIMEDYHDRTRFFLSCNYPNKIIDPIQSRCSVYYMSPLGHDDMFDLLVDIADDEGVSYKEDQLEKIVRLADGDARNAIHTLQTSVQDGSVQEENITALKAFPEKYEVEEIFEKALVGDHEAMSDLDALLDRGIDTQSLCNLFLQVIKEADVPEDARMKMMDAIGECEWRVLNGSNPNVQFNSFLATVRVARHFSFESYE
jgi:replication factor C small subunit